jgi:UDP:flavonoid glycosyltransferase YjiC (YdhE family)
MALFLMVTHGTAGDVLPFVRIGQELTGRGHDVTLLSHAPYAGAAARAGIQFVPIDTDASYAAQLAGTPELLHIHSPADLRAYYRRYGLMEQLRGEVAELVARSRPGETVVVGRHTSAMSALAAAELMDAPLAWVAVAPAQLMLAPIAFSLMQRGLADDLELVRRSHGLAPITDWRRWFNSPELLLGLWPSWFDSAGMPAPERVRLTGFVLGDEDAGAEDPGALSEPVAAMLADPRPPVLVTGGTGRLLHPRFYDCAVSAVAATGRVGLVVAPSRGLVPDRLPAGWHWEPRLPFPTVLPRVAALVHHGGIGTAVRAMRSGTPQVILAHGVDRPDNAARLAAYGLTAWAQPARWEPADLAAPLAAALTGGTEYRRRAAMWAAAEDAANGPRRAAEAIEALVPPVHRGASRREAVG